MITFLFVLISWVKDTSIYKEKKTPDSAIMQIRLTFICTFQQSITKHSILFDLILDYEISGTSFSTWLTKFFNQCLVVFLVY